MDFSYAKMQFIHNLVTTTNESCLIDTNESYTIEEKIYQGTLGSISYNLDTQN